MENESGGHGQTDVTAVLGREQINKQKYMSMCHGKRVMWTWSDRRHSSFGKRTNKQSKRHDDVSWKRVMSTGDTGKRTNKQTKRLFECDHRKRAMLTWSKIDATAVLRRENTLAGNSGRLSTACSHKSRATKLAASLPES